MSQGDMHRCAAKCCDNETYSSQKVRSCVDNCSTSLNQAHEYMQAEFERTQNRLQRCIMECNDNIRDKMGSSPAQNEVNTYVDDFERCATKCVDNYCGLLPSLESNMKKVLASRKFDH
ncbi:protein FAM136A isoform X2 [Orussus abietinus]|uniref:protein FAM136A isoform X2 n=1 Tax=Orussus abietinus TaxID=222816 RepID=UPI000626B5C0|nr:protein FAM136A isoform X2 [Orussus abietinus]